MYLSDGKIVKSAGRVLAILEFFNEIMRPASAADVRAHLNLPASSASALLGSLVDLGYLHYDNSSRTYQPTIRVGLLAEWMEHGPASALRALLQELNRQTGQLVVLGARRRLSAQYIHVVRSRGSRPVQRGALAPLTRTAVGHALISRLEDSQISRIVTQVNSTETAASRVSPSWLMEQVYAVRQNGYAFCFGLVTPGVGAIGMPLPVGPNEPPIVLAVSGNVSRFTEQRDDIVAAMREHVNRYSRARDQAA